MPQLELITPPIVEISIVSLPLLLKYLKFSLTFIFTTFLPVWHFPDFSQFPPWTGNYFQNGTQMPCREGNCSGVLYIKTLFAHLATLPSLPCFSHSSKPLPTPPWFYWTLISCGSLFLRPAGKPSPQLPRGLPGLQHSPGSWLWGAAGQGWVLAGCSCLPGAGLHMAPPNKQLHLCFSMPCKAGKGLKLWFLLYFFKPG